MVYIVKGPVIDCVHAVIYSVGLRLSVFALHVLVP